MDHLETPRLVASVTTDLVLHRWSPVQGAQGFKVISFCKGSESVLWLG
jgi:hypothetical protein